MDSLDLFSPPTAAWFTRTLGSPTAVQCDAWPAIADGRHTLVSAPTGTGKTLSAFLVFIDRLKARSRAGTLRQALSVIYISPLKSLAGDIRENLRRPLDGISSVESEMGVAADDAPFNIAVAVRTGDTTANERRKMIKNPPHILITTPESLYLLLTSKSGQGILRTAEAIIIDELHALIDSKRGAHLMLSLARLDRLCHAPLQRIGLSATIEPLDMAAEYLSPEPVTIAAPGMRKEVELAVTSPLPEREARAGNSGVWPEIARVVYEHCIGARSVIAFVEGRLFAEKLAYYVNEIGGDGFARTHHGSVSKPQRQEVERALRAGELRLLCATSSMELGIDVGDIDLVLQVGCPRSVSGTLQRLGRAGHNPGRVSVMHIFPRTASEGLYCGLTAQLAREGGVELLHPPRLCLDILAQHLVSMANGDGYCIADVMSTLTRAYPFRDVTDQDVRDVLEMLAGDYEHERDIPVRPRLLYDRINGFVGGDAYSRMLASSAGGTIPDRGQFTVNAENGTKLGELDEEFVFEARTGDKFLLGSFAWKIKTITHDDVIVTQSNVEGAQPPFWRADWSGRGMRTGMAFGAILRSLALSYEAGELHGALMKLGLDYAAAVGAEDFIIRQLEASGALPDDRTIIIEHFSDENGEPQMMVHSMFGRRVNAPLALLASRTAHHLYGVDVSAFDDEYGFMLFPHGEHSLPERLLYAIPPDTARSVLEALLPATPLFGMAFRYNSARALLMGVRRGGRQPLWVQRLRAADMLDSLINYPNHPLIRETRRECLEDYWDLDGVELVLRGIRSGEIRVREVRIDAPSPMSLPLRNQAESMLLYEYSPVTSGVIAAAENALDNAQMIAPEPEQLERMSERKRLPEDAAQLHSLLMAEGDLIAGELDVPVDWLESLAEAGRAMYIEPGLWIAAEHYDEYESALAGGDTDARAHIVRRALRYRGSQSSEQVATRYFWSADEALVILAALVAGGEAVESGGVYYHAQLYSRARRATIKNRRERITTQPPERYAALMAGRVSVTAPPAEQLETALRTLAGQSYAPAVWESVLLPARVAGYRPAMLDALLARGVIYWQLTGAGLAFYLYDDVDYDEELLPPDELSADELAVFDMLKKRGASFAASLDVSGGIHDTLMGLAERGVVHADSFVPVREWLNRDKLKKATAKRRIGSRVMAMTSGRWELSRPPLPRSPDELLEREFDRAVVLCRETVRDLTWSQALAVLRVWEYTGRARRGYFIEGLSGAQFIRERDFEGTTLALAVEHTDIVWLSGADPAQEWGRALAHLPGRSFMNVPGTAVALRGGVPVAVFERQGQVLRVFDGAALHDLLAEFRSLFDRRRIFPEAKRVTVKDYPPEAADALSNAGFTRQALDFALWRGYL